MAPAKAGDVGPVRVLHAGWPDSFRLRSRVRGLAALVVCSSALSGCFLWTTRDEGDLMRRQMDDRTTRLQAIEEGSRQQREQLREEITNAQKQVAELEHVLREATDVVTRNSADVGLQVERLQQQLATLEGRLAELQNANEQLTRDMARQRQEADERIAQLARKVGVDVPLDPTQIPQDRAAHLQTAGEAWTASDYGRARALYREFVARYAQDADADLAQYRVGASYLAENRPATALGELRKVITDYAQSDSVDDALLDMGDAFFRLHACTDARGALEALVRTQSQSPLVPRARSKLRDVERAPRGYCTS